MLVVGLAGRYGKVGREMVVCLSPCLSCGGRHRRCLVRLSFRCLSASVHAV
jgi:hypothetical protein